MIRYILEDNPDSTISKFFMKAYKNIDNDVITFANSNNRLYREAKNTLDTYKDDYVIVYLDMVPGVEIETAIYNKLRWLSIKRQYRLIVLPVPCFEYFVIKSIRSLGITEVDSQSIDICVNKENYKESKLLHDGHRAKKCINFEKYCKQVLNNAFIECTGTDGMRCKASGMYKHYYTRNCPCGNNAQYNCKELQLKMKVFKLLCNIPIFPKAEEFNSREVSLEDLWDVHRKLVKEFNMMQAKYSDNEAQYIESIR